MRGSAIISFMFYVYILGLFSLAIRIAKGTNDAKLVYHFSYDKSQKPTVFYKPFDFINTDRKIGFIPSLLTSKQEMERVDAIYKSLVKLPIVNGANFNPLLNAVTNADRAQNEDWIHLKTTLCFIALESLFSDSDKADIAFKVSLRTAAFLYPSREEKTEKEKVYKLLKSGYDFRSKFLHGSDANIGKFWEKLNAGRKESMVEPSEEMNAIVCEVLERILLSPDLFALFTDGSEKAQREYFDQLVL